MLIELEKKSNKKAFVLTNTGEESVENKLLALNGDASNTSDVGAPSRKNKKTISGDL